MEQNIAEYEYLALVINYNDFLKRISYQEAELQLGNGFFKPDSRVYEKVDKSF